MRKYFCIFLICIFAIPFYVFSQDTITITTYYPSPVGAYQQLMTNTLGVGDNDGSNSITSADAPDPAVVAQQGDVWIAGDVGIKTGTTGPARSLEVKGTDGIRIAPTDVAAIASPQLGDIAIDSASGDLQWYNGTEWSSAGGGTCYVAYFPYRDGKSGSTTPNSSYLDPDKSSCLTGFTDMGSLGPYGICGYGGTTYGVYFPPNGKCCQDPPTHWNDTEYYTGEGHLCCR